MDCLLPSAAQRGAPGLAASQVAVTLRVLGSAGFAAGAVQVTLAPAALLGACNPLGTQPASLGGDLRTTPTLAGTVLATLGTQEGERRRREEAAFASIGYVCHSTGCTSSSQSRSRR